MSRGRGANCAYQLGGDARLIRQLASSVDWLVLLECRDRDNQPIDIAAILGPDWIVWQDLRDGAHAGTAIAVRRAGPVKPARRQRVLDGGRVVVRLVAIMLRLSTGNAKVQERFLRAARLRDTSRPRGRRGFTLAGAHVALPSSGKHGAALRALATWWRRTAGRRLLIADGNTDHRTLATAIQASHSAGADVMAAVWSRGWGDTVTVRAVIYDADLTDHHVLNVKI